MKNIILLCSLLLVQIVSAQNQNTTEDKVSDKKSDTLASDKKKKGFWDKITVSESMETSEQVGEPAQLQFTLPKDKPESYVINLGVSYNLNGESRFISKVKVEFHKNSLLEKEQENLEIGYQGLLGFHNFKGTVFLVFDPKYVYDGTENKSSVAGNVLFTIKNYKSSFLKLNTNNRITDRINFIPSVYFGIQLQNSFKAKEEINTGFILRPIFSGSLSLYFNKAKKEKKDALEGIAKWSVIYTGRKDAVNNTDTDEGYTSLLKAKMEVFLINKPIRVSLGASFNKGSDPLKGLSKQEFWLLSLNVLK